MSLLGESEKGARSVEGNKKPRDWPCHPFCTICTLCTGRVSPPCQPLCTLCLVSPRCQLLCTESPRVSHFAHFAQAECPLGAFRLCTLGLDAVQMDDNDYKLRRCKLSGGRKCLRHSIAVANPGPPYPTPIQRHRCYFPLQFSTVSKQGGFNYMRSEEWKQPRWQVLSSVLGAAWTARRSRSTSHATL